MHSWLQAHGELEDDDALCSTALIIYSALRAINHYRHNGATNRVTASHYMGQAISQGIRGHKKSAAFVNNLWDPNTGSRDTNFG